MGLFNWLKKQAPTTITTPIATPIDIPPPDQIVNAWKSIIIDKSKSWVVFSHGTCVILMQPLSDLQLQAIELMRKYGPVHTGSPAGDFSIIDLTNYPGWAVTCHHNDILTYVAPDEVSTDNTINNDLKIGLYGRAKRNLDALRLEVIHIEDKRHEG